MSSPMQPHVGQLTVRRRATATRFVVRNAELRAPLAGLDVRVRGSSTVDLRIHAQRDRVPSRRDRPASAEMTSQLGVATRH